MEQEEYLGGLFPTRDEAWEAVDRLKVAGFEPDEVEIILRGTLPPGAEELARLIEEKGGPKGGAMVTVRISGGRRALAEDELRQAGALLIEPVSALEAHPQGTGLVAATNPWAGAREPLEGSTGAGVPPAA